MVVIAHRLSTVRRATRIAVLEEGRITAIGTHDELLLSSPTYLRVYQLQFMDGPEANGLYGHGPDPLEPESRQPWQLLEPALSGEAEE